MALAVDYINRFKQLKPKEKRMLAVLAVVVMGVMYYNLLLKPNFAKIAGLNTQIDDARARAKAFNGSKAQGGALAKELEDINARIKAVKAQIADTEAKLLGASDVPRLLSQLINCAQGLGINFASVTQKEQPDKSGFSRQLVDVKFDATYAQMLNYLCKIESISDVVKVDEANIMRPKEGSGDVISADITLSALLSNSAQARGQVNACGATVAGRELAVSRDPFAPLVKPQEKPAKKPNFKLIGITFNDAGGDSTVIINDTVLKKGEKVEGWIVKAISVDSVVLEGDGLTETLKVER